MAGTRRRAQPRSHVRVAPPAGVPRSARSLKWPWTLPEVGRRSDRLNSPHQTSPEAQLLTRHLTPEVVAQVGLRPAAAEAATGARSLVKDGFGCLFECQIFGHFSSIMDK